MAVAYFDRTLRLNPVTSRYMALDGVCECSLQSEVDSSVSVSEKFDSVQWDAFVRSHQNGSAFHLTAWQRTIERTFGHTPHHLAAIRSDGTIAGVLPLFLVRSRIFGRVLVST